MPHLQLDVSPFLTDTMVAENLLDDLTNTLSGFDTIEKPAIKIYRRVAECHMVGGRFDLEFCHLTLCLLTGRPLSLRKEMSAALAVILRKHIRTDRASITVEVREMDDETYIKSF